MKSVVFILLFIVSAVIFSQPEKATVKFIPINFSFNPSPNITSHTIFTQLNFTPDKVNNSYIINFDRSFHDQVQNTQSSFSFKDCDLKRRPKLSISCTKESRSEGSINKITLHPIIIYGQENIKDYLLEITYIEKNGSFMTLKYISKSENLQSSLFKNNIKVTQAN